MALRIFVCLISLVLIQAKTIELTCGQIRAFVDIHNQRRVSLAKGHLHNQPPASVMKEMVWDKELAAKAAKWANKNKYQHNPDRTLPSKRFRTGENIYLFSTTSDVYTEFDPQDALDNWFKEHRDYTFRPIALEDFSGPRPIGHYTQMAWSDTTYVGCAVSRFKQGKWHKTLVVCDYGPAGNFIGKTPYPTGQPAMRLTCEGNCNKKYGDRCSSRSNL